MFLPLVPDYRVDTVREAFVSIHTYLGNITEVRRVSDELQTEGFARQDRISNGSALSRSLDINFPGCPHSCEAPSLRAKSAQTTEVIPMNPTTLNVNLSSTGTVTSTGTNGKVVTSVTIKKNQDMVINIGTGFGTTAYINSFSLFTEVSGTKGTTIGTWNRTTPTIQPSTEMSITTNGTTGILVTDTDTVTDDQVFFAVQVTDSGTVYTTDPELKVKKMTG